MATAVDLLLASEIRYATAMNSVGRPDHHTFDTLHHAVGLYAPGAAFGYHDCAACRFSGVKVFLEPLVNTTRPASRRYMDANGNDQPERTFDLTGDGLER